MSLKSLINALFQMSGGQAMPGGSSTDISIVPNEEIYSFNWVAPANGYLHVQGAGIYGLDLQFLRGENNIGVQTYWPNTKTESQYLAGTVAVRKGQKVCISVYGADSNSLSNRAWFEPVVGET